MVQNGSPGVWNQKKVIEPCDLGRSLGLGLITGEINSKAPSSVTVLSF